MKLGEFEAAVKAAIGARFKNERQRVGLTQEQLGQKVGLHRTYIADIERGFRNLSLLNIVRLAAGLGVSVSEICTSVDNFTEQTPPNRKNVTED